MYFDHKLRGLMQLFKVSNSKLARGINVDASLVSRWKSGERVMSVNSPHIPAIASFFLKLNSYHYQKEYLDFILKSHLPEDALNDESRRIHALSDWLVSDEPIDLNASMNQPQNPDMTNNIIANIAGLMTTNHKKVFEKMTQAAETLTKPTAVPGKICDYEIYKGLTGRRQAVLNFLLSIVQSDRKHDLLLTSEDDLEWLTGDKQFTMIWASLLKQIIESGHTISVIHVVNRQKEEIMDALRYWMPLHLVGNINSYYHPRYTDQNVKRTLFISRGHITIAAWNTADADPEDTLTLYYTEKSTVAMFESIYEAHLCQCNNLFSVFTKQNCQLLLETGLETRQRVGNVFNIRSHLNALMLPHDILDSFSDKTLKTVKSKDLIQQIKLHKKVFFEKIEQEKYFDILPISLLEQIENEGQTEVDACLLCLENPLLLDTKNTIRWLLEIIDVLRQKTNYNLYLSNLTPGLEDISVNIVYKENCNALFSPSTAQKKTPISIMLSEANILRSLSYYFDDYIQKIPTVQRQREEVIERLEKLVKKLKERCQD